MSMELALDALEKDICDSQVFLDKTDETLGEYLLFWLTREGVIAYMLPGHVFSLTGWGSTMEGCLVMSYVDVLHKRDALRNMGHIPYLISRRNAVKDLLGMSIETYDILLAEWLDGTTE